MEGAAQQQKAARFAALLDTLMAEAREEGYESGRADAMAGHSPRAALSVMQARRVYENSPLINASMTYAAFERVLRVVEGVHRIERR